MKRSLTIIAVGVYTALLPACQSSTTTAALRPNGLFSNAENLEQARLAWNVMQRESPRSASAISAQQRYNQAVSAVVKSLYAREGTATWGKSISLAGEQAWTITFDATKQTASSKTFSLAEFNRCEAAEDVKLSGFDQVVAHDGIGVPVVLGQEDVHRLTVPFHPPEGEFLPATAVLEFPPVASGRPSEARLRFYNPLAVSDVSVGGNKRTMAENLTAGLERSLSNSKDNKSILSSLRPSVSDIRESRLFFLNRYDPSKAPVVFVHGLLNGPEVWKNSVNAMLADPVLRKRYQPVCFQYPTGLPIPTTSARLRELLKQSRDTLDPGHRNPSFGRMVLVGHSMGGLVSQMQTIDSGNDFWNAYFVAPPTKVSRAINAKTRRMLAGSLFFKHSPDVKLVIFIGTPHRGSAYADVGFYRSIFQLILFLPNTAKMVLEELVALPMNLMQPGMLTFSNRGVGSTEDLSTKHPFFVALKQRPIRVPFYSIIATRGEFDYKLGTDGIVPYSSSHLDGAVAEVIVPHPHGCLERTETVDAVMKILKAN